jgi:hypothetical protein
MIDAARKQQDVETASGDLQMTFPATDQPLTNKEFERLAGFLDNI